MKKIKILQFPIANSNGGITHYALENWKWMDKEKFHCDFATMSKRIDFEDEITATGSKVHYISYYAEENREQFIKDFEAILDEGYDVVHLHTKQWKSFLVEELCKTKGVKKIIVHAHSTGIDTLDEEKRRFEVELHERVKKDFSEEMATDFWACSRLAAEFLFGSQIPKEKIKIMPNAIELNRFAYNEEIRGKYRKEYGLQDCFVIGNVGRMVYQKNQEFLLDVFMEVKKQTHNAKLVIIGDGELRVELERKIIEKSLEQDVFLLGKRNDVNCWYQAMDVFCLPSRFEGFPISLIEAHHSALHCIGSDLITKECEHLDRVELLALEVSTWVNRLCQISIKNDKRSITENDSYDISKQIKNIELEYCN